MSGEGENDPWYGLLKESKQQAATKGSAFIRDVRVGAEPLCVLATDRQLNDLVRFCCHNKEHKPLTIDPTFDIGKFNVTPISYQHLMLENVKDGNQPTLIGPIMIHERKTEESYSVFCGSLKALKPEIVNLLAFGTDDEKALTNAWNKNFERATHLLCELHLKKNIERKLLELGITSRVKSEIQADIFGKVTGDSFESGISDAENQNDFLSKLSVLQSKWAALHPHGGEFHNWFSSNKAGEFIKSVIHPVRQLAGLGCPPKKFDTNRSERTNGVTQDFVRRECDGPVNEYVFAKAMQKLVEAQEKELELAILNRGEYTLRNGYKHLTISPSRWRIMTEKQKDTALKKIHSTKVDETRNNTATVSEAIRDRENHLMTTLLAAGVDWIPRNVLHAITEKALRIKEMVTMLPNADPITAIVRSTSNPKKPHVIVFSANGKCECHDCPSYSASSLCAHAIAASHEMSKFDAYVTWFVTNKRKTGGINYTKAVTHGLPNDRGRKPGILPTVSVGYRIAYTCKRCKKCRE